MADNQRHSARPGPTPSQASGRLLGRRCTSCSVLLDHHFGGLDYNVNRIALPEAEPFSARASDHAFDSVLADAN